MIRTRWWRQGFYPKQASASKALFRQQHAVCGPTLSAPWGSLLGTNGVPPSTYLITWSTVAKGEYEKGIIRREKDIHIYIYIYIYIYKERVRSRCELNLSAKLRSRASMFAMSGFNLIIRTGWIEQLTWYTYLLLTLDDFGISWLIMFVSNNWII